MNDSPWSFPETRGSSRVRDRSGSVPRTATLAGGVRGGLYRPRPGDPHTRSKRTKKGRDHGLPHHRALAWSPAFVQLVVRGRHRHEPGRLRVDPGTVPYRTPRRIPEIIQQGVVQCAATTRRQSVPGGTPAPGEGRPPAPEYLITPGEYDALVRRDPVRARAAMVLRLHEACSGRIYGFLPEVGGPRRRRGPDPGDLPQAAPGQDLEMKSISISYLFRVAQNLLRRRYNVMARSRAVLESRYHRELRSTRAVNRRIRGRRPWRPGTSSRHSNSCARMNRGPFA